MAAKVNHFLGYFADDTAANAYVSARSWTHQPGWIYRDTTLGVLKIWDAVKWVSVGGGGVSTIYEAECLEDDAVGNVIYMRGEPVGGIYKVASADPRDFDKMPGVGIIIAKNTSTECIIQLGGLIDSVFTGLILSKRYFISDAGTITLILPGAIDEDRFIQSIGVALSSTIFNLIPDMIITRRRGI